MISSHLKMISNRCLYEAMLNNLVVKWFHVDANSYVVLLGSELWHFRSWIFVGDGSMSHPTRLARWRYALVFRGLGTRLRLAALDLGMMSIDIIDVRHVSNFQDLRSVEMLGMSARISTHLDFSVVSRLSLGADL